MSAEIRVALSLVLALRVAPCALRNGKKYRRLPRLRQGGRDHRHRRPKLRRLGCGDRRRRRRRPERDRAGHRQGRSKEAGHFVHAPAPQDTLAAPGPGPPGGRRSVCPREPPADAWGQTELESHVDGPAPSRTIHSCELQVHGQPPVEGPAQPRRSTTCPRGNERAGGCSRQAWEASIIQRLWSPQDSLPPEA